MMDKKALSRHLWGIERGLEREILSGLLLDAIKILDTDDDAIDALVQLARNGDIEVWVTLQIRGGE